MDFHIDNIDLDKSFRNSENDSKNNDVQSSYEVVPQPKYSKDGKYILNKANQNTLFTPFQLKSSNNTNKKINYPGLSVNANVDSEDEDISSGLIPIYKKNIVNNNYYIYNSNSQAVLNNQHIVSQLDWGNTTNKSSGMLDIYDSEIYTPTYYFRKLTRSCPEMSIDETKKLKEKTIGYLSNLKNKHMSNINEKSEYNKEESFFIDESVANLEKIISNLTHKYDKEKNEEGFLFNMNKNKFKKSYFKQECFNILVAGDSRSGKTSLINLLISKYNNHQEKEENMNNLTFNNNYNNQANSYNNSEIYTKKTKFFTKYSIKLTNDNFKINLIDTPHLSSTKKKESIHSLSQMVCDYITNSYDMYYKNKDNFMKVYGSQFDLLGNKDNNQYLEMNKNKICYKNSTTIINESKLNNLFENEVCDYEDGRVHLVLFCIRGDIPTEYELNAMKNISYISNLIPILIKFNGSSSQLVYENLHSDEIKTMKVEFLKKAKEYKIDILDINTIISKLSDNLTINNLLGGKFGFCPPFYINIKNNLKFEMKGSIKSDMSEDRIVNKYSELNDSNDLNRLYLVLFCYLPFECIQKMKVYYHEYAKKKNNKDTLIKYFLLPTAVATGLLGAYGIIKAIIGKSKDNT